MPILREKIILKISKKQYKKLQTRTFKILKHKTRFINSLNPLVFSSELA